VVDDEAGGVLRRHRGVAELARVVGEPLAHGAAGLQAGNDLDHLHQWHRVEEVVARELARALQRGTDRRDRQRRGIGRQHCVGLDDAFQVGEQALLDVEPLDHGLDHEVAGCQVGQRRGQVKPGQAGLHLARVHAVLADQRLPGGVQGRARCFGGAGLHVEEPDLAARLGRHLGDASAHGTGPDDACTGKDGLHKCVVFGMRGSGAMTK
jgi:hypothetical protein